MSLLFFAHGKNHDFTKDFQGFRALLFFAHDHRKRSVISMLFPCYMELFSLLRENARCIPEYPFICLGNMPSGGLGAGCFPLLGTFPPTRPASIHAHYAIYIGIHVDSCPNRVQNSFRGLVFPLDV